MLQNLASAVVVIGALRTNKGMFSFATFITRLKILNHVKYLENKKTFMAIARLIELKENVYSIYKLW